MTSILITGGSGLVGRHLSGKLKEKGYDVSILSSSGRQVPGYRSYSWNPETREIDSQAVLNADFIIHLAGANIGEKRWTQKRKQEIIDSRVKTGQLIFDIFKQSPEKLRAFISASATGYYGAITSEQVFREEEPANSDFLGEICRQWEEVADLFANSGIRTIKLRTGVVLTERGGALEKLLLPVRLFVGSAMGSGKQFMPWIHVDDLCEMYVKAIEDEEMTGAYNAVAPQHVTNREFTRTIARVLKKPFWPLKVPAFALLLLFGEMSAVILEGSRVSSEKIIKAGFTFSYPELTTALYNLLKAK